MLLDGSLMMPPGKLEGAAPSMGIKLIRSKIFPMLMEKGSARWPTKTRPVFVHPGIAMV